MMKNMTLLMKKFKKIIMKNKINLTREKERSKVS